MKKGVRKMPIRRLREGVLKSLRSLSCRVCEYREMVQFCRKNIFEKERGGQNEEDFHGIFDCVSCCDRICARKD